MDRVLNRCNRDSLRNTMLKHEEMFRNQLRELHRIYKVQKKMMVDLRSKQGKNHSFVSAGSRMLRDTRLRRFYSASNSESSHSSQVSSACHYTSQLQSEYGSVHPICTRADGTNRVQSGIGLEQPTKEYCFMEARAGHDQTTLFGKKLKEKSRIEGTRLWLEEDSSIQLTLSIGR